MRVFAALARHGSLSAAARALAITHATVARRIASLEHSLGERLVERRPAGYVLTPAGTRALASIGAMEAAAQALTRRGVSDDAGPAGLVRVNAPPSLALSFLAAPLARLSMQHGGLDIELASDVRSVSLERHQADLALRLERPQDGDVIARRLATLGFGFYASAAVCRHIRAGAPPVFVGFDESNAGLPEATWLVRQFPHARIALRASNQLAQAAAAGVGAGVALLPHFAARADRRLRPCPIDPLPPPRQLWLVMRPEGRTDAAIQTVAEFLAQLCSDACSLLEGG